MSDVAVHDPEEEGKGGGGEQRRVDLTVARDAVRVYWGGGKSKDVKRVYVSGLQLLLIVMRHMYKGS